MKIFLDFDDTLFDTRTFAENIQVVFEEYGISRELFWASYQDMKGAFLMGWGYSPEAHIKKLKPDHSFDEKPLRQKLEALVSDTRRFLFPEVGKAISLLKKNNHTSCILSFGDHDFQMKKIRGTGVDRLVEKVIITQEDKAVALRSEIVDRGGATWFIDDRVKFIESVKRTFPRITTVLMQRAGRHHQDSLNNFCDHRATNLDEVVHIISGRSVW